jgi:molybdate transport system ATP-binding protein
MTIEVDVAHRLGAFALDVRFASEGRLTAFFGQSGSGKTSLVNVIGGLIRPDRGRVAVDGTTLIDTASGIFVPPHRRRVGYVFQEGRLFPHLTVRQNLMFGRWFRPPQERKVQLETVLDLLGIGHLLQRRPGALSGGEKQRVAIGRALLASPRLLLMDEPLASLDDERKAEILPFIERLRDEANVPIIYVSHSLSEVSRLANSIVVLRSGRVAAVGDPAEVLSRSEVVPQDAVEEAGAARYPIRPHHAAIQGRAAARAVPRSAHKYDRARAHSCTRCDDRQRSARRTERLERAAGKGHRAERERRYGGRGRDRLQRREALGAVDQKISRVPWTEA